MKFTSTVVLSGLLAVAVQAAPQPQASQSPEQQCLNKCNPGDVTCQAACVSVPAPNESMANNTTNCAAHCNQGSGSPEDTVAYGKCVQACITSYFYGSGAVAAATAAAGTVSGSAASVAATATGTAGATASSGTSGTETGAAATASKSSTASSSAASASASTGAALSNVVSASFAGVAGIMAAIFAL